MDRFSIALHWPNGLEFGRDFFWKSVYALGIVPRMKHCFQIRDSGIHGKGLFATCWVNAGALLGRCVVAPTTKQGPYTLNTDNGDVLVTCRFKYINHCAEPNVAYYDDFSVVALMALRPGDELTHDYGELWHESGRNNE